MKQKYLTKSDLKPYCKPDTMAVKKLQEAKTSHDKTLIQRQIESTDKKIDSLVYELYDLTPEEIKIVEESSK